MSGDCIVGSFEGAHGVKICTYRWNVKGDPKGVIFLHHGLHVHTSFDVLELGDQYRNRYSGSLVEDFNRIGLVVCGHDVRGHGRSAGKRAVVTFAEAFEDAETFIDSVVNEDAILSRLPVFLFGVSMGGMMCAELGVRRPGKYKGIVLISAALEANKGIHPPGAEFLKMIAEPLVFLFPTLPLVTIPPNKAAGLREQFLADPLTWHGKCVAKTSYEFIKAFDSLNIEQLEPPLLMMYGGKDHAVGLEQPREVFNLIQSEDKELVILDEVWHDPLHEPGFEAVRKQILGWLSDRL
ncbi:hypothetical protein NDN08_006934 [Rhodosorus marinus]|uniref:Serine aminopeptidase S33 domain-containing protein n=1 Tax=Rhodosorus marinus TaxID=101924 RepID=A0AAV8UPL4_9RHOD|nr:hypothetical protein NDN08_006934 [Rhodosorus marinus]